MVLRPYPSCFRRTDWSKPNSLQSIWLSMGTEAEWISMGFGDRDGLTEQVLGAPVLST